MLIEKKNILVLQTAFLGDLLLTIPLLKRIKRLFPEEKIFLIVREGLAPLIRDLNLVDFCFEVKKSSAKSYRSLMRLPEFKAGFKLAFCAHRSFRSALFFFQIKAKVKVGFREFWNGFIFQHRVSRNLELPEALRLMQLLFPFDPDLVRHLAEFSFLSQNSHQNDLAQTGLQAKVPSWASMDVSEAIFKMRKLRYDLMAKLQVDITNYDLVVFFPGSVWPTKQWTKKGFVDLALSLPKQGFFKKEPRIIFLGSAPESELCRSLSEEVPGSLSLAGELSLTEVVLLLSEAKLAVTNDSGSMHMASLVGCPTLAVFGPTTLSLGFRPWQDRALVVENRLLSCRPCGLHGHKKCPLGTHECMKSITAQEVIGQMRRAFFSDSMGAS